MADGSDTLEKEKVKVQMTPSRSNLFNCRSNCPTKYLQKFVAAPLSNYGGPGTSLGDGCWLAEESRRQGCRIGTEEERGWGEACQGIVRVAGGR